MRQSILITSLLIALASLGACSSNNACEHVQLMDSCKAHCVEASPGQAGATLICADMLQIAENSQNNITHGKTKHVTTHKLAGRTCFEVNDGQVVDAAQKEKLVAECKQGGAL